MKTIAMILMLTAFLALPALAAKSHVRKGAVCLHPNADGTAFSHATVTTFVASDDHPEFVSNPRPVTKIPTLSGARLTQAQGIFDDAHTWIRQGSNDQPPTP